MDSAILVCGVDAAAGGASCSAAPPSAPPSGSPGGAPMPVTSPNLLCTSTRHTLSRICEWICAGGSARLMRLSACTRGSRSSRSFEKMLSRSDSQYGRHSRPAATEMAPTHSSDSFTPSWFFFALLSTSRICEAMAEKYCCMPPVDASAIASLPMDTSAIGRSCGDLHSEKRYDIVIGR